MKRYLDAGSENVYQGGIELTTLQATGSFLGVK